jgi:hypothetical protein
MHATRDILRKAEKRAIGGKHELKVIVDRERLEQFAVIATATKILGVKIACGREHKSTAIDRKILKKIFN